MTPLGRHIRALRKQRGITLTEMARSLESEYGRGIDVAQLSRLETGRLNGLYSPLILDAIVKFFGFDPLSEDAMKIYTLASESRTTLAFNLSGLSEPKIKFMNRLYKALPDLNDDELESLCVLL